MLEVADRKDHNPGIGDFRVVRRRDVSARLEPRRCKVSVGSMASTVAPLGHHPVLLHEMLAALAVREDGIYLDATFGVGGYSRRS
jgi:hypothetical protein